MNGLVGLLLTVVAFPALCIPQEGQALLRSNDGEQTVQLESFDSLTASIVVDDQAREMPVEQIDSIQFSQGTATTNKAAKEESTNQGTRIRLVDGSTLIVNQWSVDDEKVLRCTEGSFASNWFQLNTRNVTWVLAKSQVASVRDQWPALLASESPTTDWLVFEREGVLDFVEGQIDLVGEDAVRFETGDRVAEAPLDRVAGLVWFHAAGREFVNPTALLTTVSGSRLFLRSLRLATDHLNEADSRWYSIETVCGARFDLPGSQIANIDFSAVRSQYLSDLVPSTIEWDPLFYTEEIYQYLARLNGPRFDESFQRSTLRLSVPGESGGRKTSQLKSFAKGIAVKGGTRMVFALDGQYATLQGVCGFDPEAPLDGFVEVIFAGDGRELDRHILNNTAPQPEVIDVSIAGVQRLTIQVKYHDGRNIGDVLHFCDLRVSR